MVVCTIRRTKPFHHETNHSEGGASFYPEEWSTAGVKSPFYRMYTNTSTKDAQEGWALIRCNDLRGYLPHHLLYQNISGTLNITGRFCG